MNLADAKDALAARDQQVIAGRFCRQIPTCLFGAQGVVTWAPDGLSFMVEHRDEQAARLIGYREASEVEAEREWQSEKPLIAVCWGTRRTERGTFAAQFTLEDPL